MEVPMRKRKLPADAGDPAWIDMHQAQQLSSLGRSTINSLIKQGLIRTSKVGKRLLIDPASLLAHIASRATGGLQPAVEVDGEVGKEPAPVTPKRRAGPRSKVVTIKPRRKAANEVRQHPPAE
jgi:hypothetical protein